MIISSCFQFTDLHFLDKLPRWNISVRLISLMGSYSIFDGELDSGHIKPVLIITDVTKDKQMFLAEYLHQIETGLTVVSSWT